MAKEKKIQLQCTLQFPPKIMQSPPPPPPPRVLLSVVYLIIKYKKRFHMGLQLSLYTVTQISST